MGNLGVQTHGITNFEYPDGEGVKKILSTWLDLSGVEDTLINGIVDEYKGGEQLINIVDNTGSWSCFLSNFLRDFVCTVDSGTLQDKTKTKQLHTFFEKRREHELSMNEINSLMNKPPIIFGDGSYPCSWTSSAFFVQ